MELDKLNEKQKQAVITTDGALLILAGAGSGKTRVITNKIAYLIEEKNVNPYNILAITFTNKAAKEMQSRVEDLIGIDSKRVWISTFHAFCTRILRYEASHILYENNFTIYDTQDKQVLIKNCMDILGYDKETLNIASVASEISRAKDSMVSVDDYEAEATSDYRNSKIARVYRLYQEELKKNNAMDFDDLIYNCIRLFKLHKEVLGKYQDKFEYIMVDEYQDTNYSQYLLIKMLSQKHKNICVVGDDDQSIYGWRGADIRNILEFEKDFENVIQIKLEQNYRSTSNIINAAGTVIKNNEGRKDKKIWTSSDNGDKITIYEATSENDESLYVAQNIRKLTEQGYKYSDFAVLYRANALSRKYEEAFMKYKIPYKIFGGLKFYDRMEIKDILAYLRLIDNKNDDVSLKRIINVPKRGIGAKTVEKLEQYAREHSISMLDSIEYISQIIGAGKAQESIKKFAVMIGALKAFAKILPVSELLEKVISSTNYENSLIEEKTPESQSRLENINELKSVIQEFERTSEDKSLSDFLQNATLSTDMDEDDKKSNYATLMTIHSAKGLEFPVVFIVAAEENIFPSSRSVLDESKLEEERRLCYVAITRAKEKLFITRAKSRLLYGKTNCNLSSRFISEIDKDLVINEKKEYYVDEDSKQAYSLHQKYIEKYKIMNEHKKDEPQDIKIGTKVSHKTFGKGMIVGKTGGKYSIVFDKVGVKTIDTSVVKLEILS
ncbi:putative ATP-dependent DNA helicase PcrA [Peptoanaerobacter stomatis]|uniref:DNA 3'-5' helicase n=1 Tax=Peptoanaerobacter stomatis TaxID=796937 RepID=J5UAG8_9FIRM|nr:UvrD-helicase domain-containing protein [Peptoanaerobacter stomatis]EJU21039.1 putative ATP-dependent DNA helicase PcrA [Peptoanaerobacter stomatis]NWO25418.1 UvrD-helicase domain-containing protein [Peptostreptococcaceae bacterium oral taxon 081]